MLAHGSRNTSPPRVRARRALAPVGLWTRHLPGPGSGSAASIRPPAPGRIEKGKKMSSFKIIAAVAAVFVVTTAALASDTHLLNTAPRGEYEKLKHRYNALREALEVCPKGLEDSCKFRQEVLEKLEDTLGWEQKPVVSCLDPRLNVDSAIMCKRRELLLEEAAILTIEMDRFDCSIDPDLCEIRSSGVAAGPAGVVGGVVGTFLASYVASKALDKAIEPVQEYVDKKVKEYFERKVQQEMQNNQTFPTTPAGD